MRTDSAVLFVSGDPAETIIFERVIGEHLVLKRVQDLAELQAVLDNGDHCDAVLCGGSFRKDDWKGALRYLLPRGPDLPVIISRRIGTESEWVEVLGVGPFDLLGTPYGDDPVLRVLEHAVASYETKRLRNAFQTRPSPKQAGRERSGTNIAPRRVRGGTRRSSYLRPVSRMRVALSSD